MSSIEITNHNTNCVWVTTYVNGHEIGQTCLALTWNKTYPDVASGTVDIHCDVRGADDCAQTGKGKATLKTALNDGTNSFTIHGDADHCSIKPS